MTINNKFTILNFIGNGKFGEVWKGSNIRTNEVVAIKIENSSSKFKILKRETTILNYLFREHVKKVPSIYWFGQYENNTCLIMTYFSLNILEYMESLSELNITTLYKIMKKCLNVLKSIHQHGVLHRDIKPQNFMIKHDDIYLIDFGLSIFYIDENDRHIEKQDSENVVGTPKYISYFNHNGEPNSRRDDLLSLGYLILLLVNGSLPWEEEFLEAKNFTDSNIQETSIQHPCNIERKTKKTLENILKICNEELDTYFQYCYNLNYYTNPDYDVLIDIF